MVAAPLHRIILKLTLLRTSYVIQFTNIFLTIIIHVSFRLLQKVTEASMRSVTREFVSGGYKTSKNSWYIILLCSCGRW